MAKRSPPMPFSTGCINPIIALAAIAASIALPPFLRISTAASEASGCSLATIPCCARTGERVAQGAPEYRSPRLTSPYTDVVVRPIIASAAQSPHAKTPALSPSEDKLPLRIVRPAIRLFPALSYASYEPSPQSTPPPSSHGKRGLKRGTGKHGAPPTEFLRRRIRKRVFHSEYLAVVFVDLLTPPRNPLQKRTIFRRFQVFPSTLVIHAFGIPRKPRSIERTSTTRFGDNRPRVVPSGDAQALQDFQPVRLVVGPAIEAYRNRFHRLQMLRLSDEFARIHDPQADRKVRLVEDIVRNPALVFQQSHAGSDPVIEVAQQQQPAAPPALPPPSLLLRKNLLSAQ